MARRRLGSRLPTRARRNRRALERYGHPVTTKVPVANVLALASLAYHTLPIPPAIGDALLEPVNDVVDWLAVLLTAEIQALVAHGLRQDYVVVQDELPYVRGRLRFDVTALSARRALMACEFADFLPDIPENRILRAGLEVLEPSGSSQGCAPASSNSSRAFSASPTSAQAAGTCRPGKATGLTATTSPRWSSAACCLIRMG